MRLPHRSSSSNDVQPFLKRECHLKHFAKFTAFCHKPAELFQRSPFYICRVRRRIEVRSRSGLRVSGGIDIVLVHMVTKTRVAHLPVFTERSLRLLHAHHCAALFLRYKISPGTF
ncbi:unnamed protein product [Ixodes persulcatus]